LDIGRIKFSSYRNIEGAPMAFSGLSRFHNMHLRPFAGAAVVICMGLALRGYGYALGIPFIVVKYGGSTLWGAMVYLLLAAMLPIDKRKVTLAAAALVVVAVELLRLYHVSWLDEFRLTIPGALLLGRVFSPWNILAYLMGIGAACIADRSWLRSVR
jgi:hypothetical protein